MLAEIEHVASAYLLALTCDTATEAKQHAASAQAALDAAGERATAYSEIIELWDAVVAEWFADGIPDSQRANVGKFVKEFRQLNATPAEIGIRRKRIRECWGAGKDTPASTLKHWSVFKDDQKPQNDRPSRIPVPKGKYDHLDRQAR